MSYDAGAAIFIAREGTARRKAHELLAHAARQVLRERGQYERWSRDHSSSSIAYVNDKLGRDAVEEMYQLAIHTAETREV